MGTFERVNDPKESKKWRFNFFLLNPQSETSFNDELFDRINSFILRRSKILCLSKDNNIANPDDIESLTKGYSYSRMWAQYADNHTGACLVFGKSELENEFDSFFSNKIKFKGDIEYLNTVHGPNTIENGFPVDPYNLFYEELQKLGFDPYLYAHIQKFYNYVYLFKHYNWHDENEFRFVILDEIESANHEYFLPIRKSLKQIIITEDFPKDKLPTLLNHCQNLNIKIDRLIWRGWSIHLMPIQERESYSLDGISLPTHFDYSSFCTQVCDNNGKMQTLMINQKNGEMKLRNLDPAKNVFAILPPLSTQKD